MSWIVIDEIEATGKTKCFNVRTADRSIFLGRVSFYPRWRKYAFYPAPDTLYERDCLTELADFCEEETTAWRAQIAQRRKERV